MSRVVLFFALWFIFGAVTEKESRGNSTFNDGEE